MFLVKPWYNRPRYISIEILHFIFHLLLWLGAYIKLELLPFFFHSVLLSGDYLLLRKRYPNPDIFFCNISSESLVEGINSLFQAWY